MPRLPAGQTQYNAPIKRGSIISIRDVCPVQYAIRPLSGLNGKLFQYNIIFSSDRFQIFTAWLAEACVYVQAFCVHPLMIAAFLLLQRELSFLPITSHPWSEMVFCLTFSFFTLAMYSKYFCEPQYGNTIISPCLHKKRNDFLRWETRQCFASLN